MRDTERPGAPGESVGDGDRGPRHLPALDGLRGIAVLLVLAHHVTRDWRPEGWLAAPLAVLQVGWVGVDLFFALSGFLITGTLLESRGRPGYYPTFYARRALRIWPLYLLVVGVLSAWAVWRAPDTAAAATFRAHAGWYWTHTVNWLAGARGWGALPYGTVPFWTLAIEEQFYLAWPLAVAACPRTRLPALCLALAAASLALRLGLLASGSAFLGYVATPTHLEALMGGAALAIAGDRLPRVRGMLAAGAGVAALGVVAALVASGGKYGAPVQGVGLPLLAGAATLLVASSARGPQNGGLAHPTLRWLGRYSYALYLLHYPVMAALGVGGFDAHDGRTAAVRLLAVLVTLPLAWASWHLWEKRWLALRRHVPVPAEALALPRWRAAGQPL